MHRLAALVLLAAAVVGCDAPRGDAPIDAVHPADATHPVDVAIGLDAVSPIDAGPDTPRSPGPWTDGAVLETSDDHAVGLVVEVRDGHGIAAWTMVACAATCDGPGVPWFARSRDGVWSAGAPISSLAGTRVVAATADDAGHFMLYTVRSGQHAGLEASRYDDGAWGDPEPLQADPEADGDRAVGIVRVAGHGFGNQMVVWEEASGATVDIWSNRYSYLDGWLGPRRLDVGDGAASGPMIALGETGVGLAGWLQDGLVTISRYGPTSQWTAPAALGPGTASPELTWGGDGAGTVIWRDGATLREARLHGPDRAPIEVDGGAGITSDHVALAASATGRVTALWLAGAADARDLCEASYDPATGWGPPTGIDSLSGAADRPAAVFGPGDQVLATWLQAPAAVAPPAAWSSRRGAAGWSEPALIADGPVTQVAPYHDSSIDRFGAVWLASTDERTSVFQGTLAP